MLIPLLFPIDLGSNDAVKLAKILHDSSLNFKYATLEKATGSFDNANKLGQGGFGTVYKVVNLISSASMYHAVFSFLFNGFYSILHIAKQHNLWDFSRGFLVYFHNREFWLMEERLQ